MSAMTATTACMTRNVFQAFMRVISSDTLTSRTGSSQALLVPGTAGLYVQQKRFRVVAHRPGGMTYRGTAP